MIEEECGMNMREYSELEQPSAVEASIHDACGGVLTRFYRYLQRHREVLSDPVVFMSHAWTKLYSLWMIHTYPFARTGRDLSIGYPCNVDKALARYISLGDHVVLRKDAGLSILPSVGQEATIVIGSRCSIGPRCSISAANGVYIEDDVILAASVLITDHNHAYENVEMPIRDQGVTSGGRIQIQQGSWIGWNAAIVANDRDIVIGRHSVIGANTVVTRSVPPYSVVSGNPGRVVRRYDTAQRMWSFYSPASREPERSVPGYDDPVRQLQDEVIPIRASGRP